MASEQRMITAPRPRTVRTAVFLIVLLTLAACGTTVQSAGQSSSAQGLAVPGTSPSNPGGETGGPGAVSGVQPGGLSGPSSGPAAGTTGGAIGTGTQGTVGAHGGGGAAGTAGTAGATGAHSPIEIGIFDQDNPSTAIASVGGQGSVSVSAADIVQALVAYYNAHGGIAGRKIKLVEYTLKTTDTDWRVDAQAACADFTQDHHVQVAMSSVGGGVFLDNYEACLAHAGVPDLQYGSVGGQQSFAHFPAMFGSVFAPVDDAYGNLLRDLRASGYLTPRNKIGVVIENCNYDAFAYSHTVAPLAKQLGLDIVRTQSVDCLYGYGDAGNFGAQVGAAVLPFRTAGVDRVIFVSTWEALALLFFDKQAQSQGYAVNYALTSYAQIAVNAKSGNFSSSSLARMQGVGWWPEVDITAPPTTAPASRCRTMAAAEGLDAHNPSNAALIDWVCNPFLMLEAGLRSNPGSDTPQAIVASLEGLGRSLASSTTIRAETSLSPTRHDEIAAYQRFLYSASCSCFRYA